MLQKFKRTSSIPDRDFQFLVFGDKPFPPVKIPFHLGLVGMVDPLNPHRFDPGRCTHVLRETNLLKGKLVHGGFHNSTSCLCFFFFFGGGHISRATLNWWFGLVLWALNPWILRGTGVSEFLWVGSGVLNDAIGNPPPKMRHH